MLPDYNTSRVLRNSETMEIEEGMVVYISPDQIGKTTIPGRVGMQTALRISIRERQVAGVSHPYLGSA